MDIYLNVTFPRLPCAIMSLDVMDVSGAHQNEISHHIYKIRIDLEGNKINAVPEKELVGSTIKNTNSSYCGSCYGGKSPNSSGCCNTCGEVKAAYENMNWSTADLGKMEQ
ncbi:hypothetical protein HMI55_003031, partial [Coelomomyces lativittatus]